MNLFNYNIAFNHILIYTVYNNIFRKESVMKKKIILALAAVAVIAIGVFAGIKIKDYLPYYNDKTGRHQENLEYVLTIEKSDFENEVALRLQEQKIIISAARFLGYLHKHFPDFVWYNGVYTLNADMSYDSLCRKLQSPDYRIEYVKLTVPEGKNIAGISKIVEQSGLCTAREFLEAADSYDYNYSFMEELRARDQSKIGYKLEGFLFPATYEFRKDTVTAREIVDKMLSAFSGYVTEDITEKAADLGLSLSELVTFASVVQAEALSKESMAGVASVFWNRLNSSSLRRLQSDPTTTYAKSLKTLENYSQAMYDAYDTYTCVGLPSGPTNCPGMDTINAVLNPADTDYYYFVTDKDGNFYYNETYDKHVKTCYDIGLWKR